jgi:DNA-directed RNA polymerase subunit RPC12/RpoP
MTEDSPPSILQRRLAEPGSPKRRDLRCRKCGDWRQLDLPPAWDRRTLVEIVCPKCGARGLLPTGRLLLYRTLGVALFVASTAFVIYTLLRQR